MITAVKACGPRVDDMLTAFRATDRTDFFQKFVEEMEDIIRQVFVPGKEESIKDGTWYYSRQGEEILESLEELFAIMDEPSGYPACFHQPFPVDRIPPPAPIVDPLGIADFDPNSIVDKVGMLLTEAERSRPGWRKNLREIAVTLNTEMAKVMSAKHQRALSDCAFLFDLLGSPLSLIHTIKFESDPEE